MKKKFADCSKINDIQEKEFKKIAIKNDPYWATVCCTTILKVTNKWDVPRENGNDVTILDVGYKWITLYPKAENFAITAIYNAKSELVEFYFDIAKKVKYKSRIPYILDLYLDIVMTKDNQVIFLDEEELKNALNTLAISQKDYDLAKRTADKIVNKFHNQQNFEELKETAGRFLNDLA
ncbi:MAG: DUF402 domain-containing protein [Clostridia bacterium]